MDRETSFVVNGLALSIAVLVHDLDANGAISKDIYLDTLRRSADGMEANPGPRLNELSAAILRRIVRIVELGPDEQAAAWEPLVIQGGKPVPDNPQTEGR